MRLLDSARHSPQGGARHGEAGDSDARMNTRMENLPSIIALLLPVLAILMSIAIVWIVFWYKARQRELDLQENLRLREFEHLQRLKELELETEKARARDPAKPA